MRLSKNDLDTVRSLNLQLGSNRSFKNQAMSIKFTKLGSILLITAISSLFTVQAQAETASQKKDKMQPLTTAEVFEKAFFDRSGDFFQNDRIFSQLNTILGFNRFPEKQITLDGKSVHMLYRDKMQTQAGSGTPIRTRDLINPYTTSLQENPEYIGY